ncbi:MAG: NAD(P)/FAD-dependent oxidoreductase [Oscillospiraceae bacterium]|nr:NAD(P)/FAD-dependent oxidoreductase [Oscillospiraceae bacterium]
MSSDSFRYPHLFEPVTLGRTVFRNRLFSSPMSGRNLDPRFRPDDNYTAFYERKAIGGAASVCLGDCVVDSVHGMFGEPMIRLDDPSNHTPLNRLTAAVRRHGAVCSVELQHGGRYSYQSAGEGHAIYGPCAGVDANGLEYLEMPEDVIWETVEKYARAAAFAKACGCGMVTIHGGHGWLLSQFMSSKVNLRKDRWGGSLENRMRFPLAVCDAVRKAVGPGFPVEIRISGSEVTPAGYDLDEGIAIAKMLDGHADLIHVSAGHHENTDVFTVTHPSIFMEDSCNVKYAAAIKPHIRVSRIATVGAHSDPDLLEEIVASGKADVIEIARALMADPDLPRKARAGRPEEIRPCLRCLACFSHLITNGQIFCAVNPEIGREAEKKHESPAVPSRTVLVAGGGIGGMQAAIEAAERGHKVILCEKSGRLGGALKCEESVPFKRKIRAYLEYQERKVRSSGAEIRLNTEVTKAYADSVGADVIIASVGAVPFRPPVPGIESTLTAEEIYADTSLAGGRVAVLGGGLVGTELAIYLAQLGRKVCIVEMAPALNSGGNILHQTALDLKIRELGIETRLGVRATSVRPDGVEGEGGVFVPADTVVCAMGQRPLSEEAWSLRECAPQFFVIGDSVTPKNIMQATAMADAAVRDIF